MTAFAFFATISFDSFLPATSLKSLRLTRSDEIVMRGVVPGKFAGSTPARSQKYAGSGDPAIFPIARYDALVGSWVPLIQRLTVAGETPMRAANPACDSLSSTISRRIWVDQSGLGGCWAGIVLVPLFQLRLHRCNCTNKINNLRATLVMLTASPPHGRIDQLFVKTPCSTNQNLVPCVDITV